MKLSRGRGCIADCVYVDGKEIDYDNCEDVFNIIASKLSIEQKEQYLIDWWECENYPLEFEGVMEDVEENFRKYEYKINVIIDYIERGELIESSYCECCGDTYREWEVEI